MAVPDGQVILNVDDEEVGRYATTRVLQRAGYTVVEAAWGGQALRLVAKRPPDLIVLDVHLPDMSGFEVCRRLKQDPATAHIPIMHLSASAAESASLAEGLDTGADACLAEPVDPAVLLAMVRALLRARRAEEARRESEERYRQLFRRMQEGMSVGEIIVDGDGQPVDFRYLDANPANERITGAPREQLVGHTVKELAPEGDPGWIAMLGEVALTGKPVSMELHPAASKRWLQFQAYSPRPGEAAMILSDISERKRAEEARRQAEETLARQRALLETVLQQMQAGVTVVDGSGEVVMTSERALEILGRPTLSEKAEERAERLESRYPDGRRYDPEDVPEARSLRRGEVVREEEMLVTRGDGAEATLLVCSSPLRDAAGVITGAVATFGDITARKRAEAELFQAHQRLQWLLDAVPVGISFSDSPDCAQITGNAACLSQFEVGADDNLSASAAEPSAPGRQVCYFQEGREIGDRELPLQRAVAEDREIEPVEIEVVLPNGRRWIAEASGAPLHDARGNVIGGVAVTVDITERRRLEQVERERAREARLFETIVENTPGWLAYLDRDLRYLRVNSAYAAIAGQTPEGIVGRGFEDVFPNSSDIRAMFEQVRDTGEPRAFHGSPRVLSHRPELKQRYLDFVVTPVKDEAGAVEGLVVSVTDVTREVQAGQQAVAAERARAHLAESLNDEISHRVKNNLAMVSGLFQLQALREPDSRVVSSLRDAMARIRAFATIHDELYKTHFGEIDICAALRGIAESTVAALGGEEIKLSVGGDPATYPPQHATNIVVLANELLTNGIKHGAPASDGHLYVDIRVALVEGYLHIAVRNSGNPVPAGFSPLGEARTGLHLVYDLVVNQYGGAFGLEAEGDGSVAEMVVAEGRLRE